jgi:hypothetical protein
MQLHKLKERITKIVRNNIYNPWKLRNLPKIFGIGQNKTGTTSLTKAMKDLGFITGNQREAELLLKEYAKRDFGKLIKYCKKSQFFQDFPFSFPYTFIVMDQNYKNSKFILTIRDNPEQWYKSLTSFHSKIWGKNGKLPDKNDLMEATYIYKGRPWDSNRINFFTPEDDLYNKEILIKHYNDYNESVINYFRNRPHDLLILNVAERGAFKKLTDFLNIKSNLTEFPWKNKT